MMRMQYKKALFTEVVLHTEAVQLVVIFLKITGNLLKQYVDSVSAHWLYYFVSL